MHGWDATHIPQVEAANDSRVDARLQARSDSFAAQLAALIPDAADLAACMLASGIPEGESWEEIAEKAVAAQRRKGEILDAAGVAEEWAAVWEHRFSAATALLDAGLQVTEHTCEVRTNSDGFCSKIAGLCT